MVMLTLLIAGERRTRKLLPSARPAAPRCRCLEIFIAALVITPGAWLFWAVTNAPPAM